MFFDVAMIVKIESLQMTQSNVMNGMATQKRRNFDVSYAQICHLINEN